MDVSDGEGRKRDREDNENTISGPDISSTEISDSLLGNTSIEQDSRRRRLSAVSETPAAAAIAANTGMSVSQQMDSIAEDAMAFVETVEMPEHIQHPATFPDLSEQAVRQNTLAMVQGITAMTDEIVYTSALHTGAPSQSLEWDDAGLTPHPLPPSPLPVPNLPHSPASVSPAPAPAPAPPVLAPLQVVPGLNGQEIMSAVRDKLEDLMGSFKEQLQSTCSNIDSIISAKLNEVTERVEANSLQINDNKNSIAVTNEWVTLLEETQEKHDRNIQEINQRIDDIAERETEIRNVTDQYVETARDNAGHIDRLESAVSMLQRGAPVASSPQLQLLMERIQSLERAQEQSDKLLHQYRIDKERQDDFYFLRSLSIKGFHPLRKGSSSRSLARKVLATIGCEDVLSSVQAFSFNKSLSDLRLTFSTIHEMSQASQWLAEGLYHARRHDNNLRMSFRSLTPPRFHAERYSLDKIGMAMKKNGECKRYFFAIINHKLVMRTHKPGQPDQIIHAPQDSTQPDQRGEDMDTDAPTGSCSICGDQFNNSVQLAIYFCGHSFHEVCLSATIESQGLKCPICRKVPPTLSANNLNCEQCFHLSNNGLPVEEDGLCVSSKCHHLHSLNCQTRYLSSREVDIPSTRESAELMRLNRQFKGCYSCSVNVRQPSRLKDFMYLVKFTDNFPDFTDLGMNPPFATPQRMLPHNPTVMEVINGSTGAVPRREANSNNGQSQFPPLSGANSVPQGQRSQDGNPRHLGGSRGGHRGDHGVTNHREQGHGNDNATNGNGRDRSPVRRRRN